MKRLGLHLRTFLLIAWLARGDGYSCPYGQHCAYEPSPPGRAPPCAQPGLTYCIHPEPYPEQVIRRLIEAGQYDISTLLSDESRDDFNSNKKMDYPYNYGPNSLPHVDQISIVNEPKNYNTKFHSRFNHEIFSQKTPLQPPSPVDPSPYNINAFQNFSKFGFSNPNYWAPSFDYEKKLYRQNNVFNQNYYNTPLNQYDSADWFRQAASGVTQYNPNEWWKYMSPSRADVTVERSVTFPTRSSPPRRARRRRNAELVRAASRRKLTGAEALRIALGLASAETSAERSRRQAPGAGELCRARTDYVMPRAALNIRGSWRFVPNMRDNMTQLVRVEICMATECSNLCSVPVGYSSRCEQKFIQKRLVALDASGQNLYTDIFWFPSCCQCTIVANNT